MYSGASYIMRIVIGIKIMGEIHVIRVALFWDYTGCTGFLFNDFTEREKVRFLHVISIDTNMTFIWTAF